MASGISNYLANKLLNGVCRNQPYTPPTSVYAKIHKGEPGADGLSNQSATTTRVAVTFADAANGSIAITGSPEFTLTAQETISHVSFWDAVTGGNFLWSSQATASKTGDVGDIIRISTNVLSIGPVAS